MIFHNNHIPPPHPASATRHCRRWFLCLLAATAITAAAQNDSLPSATTHTIAVGAANVLDTYLSAEKYRGLELRYIAHLTSPTRWRGISRTVVHQGQIANLHNRADNNDELQGAYRLLYALRHNWQLGQLTLAAGGGIDANIGFLYNMRNSNNPAQARLGINIASSLGAIYTFTYGAFKFRAGYEASFPLVGLMFSPNYGQSYYEIFNRDNNDHNIVPTTLFCTPSLWQTVYIDIKPYRRWSHTWLHLSYLGDFQQAKVNNLKYHHYSHLVGLGITHTL